jgi:hypothetical protein
VGTSEFRALTLLLPDPAVYVSVSGVLPVGMVVFKGLILEEVELTGTELSMVPCRRDGQKGSLKGSVGRRSSMGRMSRSVSYEVRDETSSDENHMRKIASHMNRASLSMGPSRVRPQ